MKKKLIYGAAALILSLLLRTSHGGEYLAMGLFVGGAYCVGLWAPLAAFLLSSVFFGIDSVIVAIVQGAVISAAIALHAKFKKRINKWLLILYIISAGIFPFVWKWNGEEVFQRVINLALSAGFSFVCVYVLRALYVRGLTYRLGTDEALCLAVFVAALARSLAPLTISSLSVLDAVAPFAILFMLEVNSPSSSYAAAVCLGAGALLATLSPLSVCAYALFAFAAVSFRPLSRYVSALAILLFQLCLLYFFNLYGTGHYLLLVPTFAGCLAFCVIPNGLLKKINALCGKSQVSAGVEPIVNRLRGQIANKLFELSDVFYQMQITYKSLMGQILSPQNAVAQLSRQVSDAVCRDCPERARCWREKSVTTDENLAQLISAGLDKGKATVIDVPDGLASDCMRISTLLAAANKEITSYKAYYGSVTNQNTGKLLLAEQLGGISTVMMELSNKCKNKLTFDREKEKKALEELTFLSVLVKEVVVCEEKDEPLITLTVAAKDAEKGVILPVMNRIMGRQLELSKCENTPDGLWRILFFLPKPKYNITLGFCQRIKQSSGESGDTHSFLRLNGNKILLALCDGMGSGEKARSTSSTAISLVENFYKADFDSEIVLSSVNKLLSANSEESFSALDVCALNLNNGNTDFIKLGCPHSVVKTKGGVSFIQGGSLPLGVLEQIKPVTTKKIMTAGDVIVMYSDGFSDCFADKNEIAYLLEQNTLTNAQLISETMLAEAMARCSDAPADDVTVIAARIING